MRRETGCGRTTIRLRAAGMGAADTLSHGGARYDQHIGPACGQPHDRRLTLDGGCAAPGRAWSASASVRKCRALRSSAHRGPPGPTKLTLLTATRRAAGPPDLAPHQPGWSDALGFADDPHVLASGAREVAVQFRGVACRAAHPRAGDVHRHSSGHWLFPGLTGRWKVNRRRGDAPWFRQAGHHGQQAGPGSRRTPPPGRVPLPGDLQVGQVPVEPRPVTGEDGRTGGIRPAGT